MIYRLQQLICTVFGHRIYEYETDFHGMCLVCSRCCDIWENVLDDQEGA